MAHKGWVKIVPVDTKRNNLKESREEIKALMTEIVSTLSAGNTSEHFRLAGNLAAILQKYTNITKGDDGKRQKLAAKLTEGIDNEIQHRMWTSLFSTCDTKGEQQAHREFLENYVIKN